MTPKHTGVLTVFLIAILGSLGGAAVLKGGLYLGKHEGDTLHLMQVVFRMAEGQVPHLDFMTPLGLMAFWPIAKLVEAGSGIGAAVIWTQVLAACLFLPGLVWIGWSRLSSGLAAMFGAVVLVLLLALVHGEAERSVSISMHYNRLAWAAAFVAIVASLLPPQRGRGTVDGIVIGAALSLMALIKMTYLAAFVVPILIALVLTGQRRAIWVAVLTGLSVILGVALAFGVEFWLAYANDLLTVLRSDVRPAPGEPLSGVIGAPPYLGGSIAAVAAVIVLRQAGLRAAGLVILLLIPGFFYVTYQNFGNDPQWLLLLGVLLLAFHGRADAIVTRFGWTLRDALGVLAAVVLAFAVPSFVNLTVSPFRHLYLDTADYTPYLPRGGVHEDLQALTPRIMRIDARVALDGQSDLLDYYVDRGERRSFRDIDIPFCTVEIGLPRYIDAIARDIENAGLAEGRSVFVADVFSSHWLFSALEPLKDGAPWYYGGLPGIETADYLLVPICPVIFSAQGLILGLVEDRIDAGELSLTEVRRTDLYVLYGLN